MSTLWIEISGFENIEDFPPIAKVCFIPLGLASCWPDYTQHAIIKTSMRFFVFLILGDGDESLSLERQTSPPPREVVMGIC